MSTSDTNKFEITQPGSEQPSFGSPKPVSHWLIAGVYTSVIVLCIVIYMGIHERALADTKLTKDTEQASVPTVTVVNPLTNSASQEIVLPGNTQAFNDTPIYARTNGYLKHWYVDIGAHVKQGQLLADIETPEIDRQVEQAMADLKTAEANEHLAQTTAARWQAMLKANAVSKQETDQDVSDLSARQATVESMAANLHRLQELQSFEKVYAPFSGVITARNTDIGALINAGAGGTPQELFHIAAVDKLRVYVAVPEVDSQAAEIGAKATLTLDEFPGEKFEGTIVRNADAIDLASRTLNVEVDLDNKNGRIKSGAYAFVHFTMPRKGATAAQSLTVPVNALLFRAEGLRVGVVRNGRVDLLPISIGRDFGSSVEVVAGLRPSDKIIINPSDSIVSGSPVRLSNATAGDSK